MIKLHPETIFENERFIAINKPAGLLSIPDREQTQTSLKDILIAKYGKIYTVHRLDKDTSGIIVFAKDEDTHKFLCQLFEERKTQKIYQGLVIGLPQPPSGTIDAPISESLVHKGVMVVHRNGKPAITDYQVIEPHKAFTLVQFHLHTGRTHQIRVHCKHIGHPLLCDEIYGDGKPFLLSSLKKKFKLSKHDEEERPMLSRLALHAYSLAFTDIDGQEITLSAPLPKDMSAVCRQLQKNP